MMINLPILHLEVKKYIISKINFSLNLWQAFQKTFEMKS